MGTLVCLIAALVWQGDVSGGNQGAFGMYLWRVSYVSNLLFVAWLVTLVISIGFILWFRRTKKEGILWFDPIVYPTFFVFRLLRTTFLWGLATLWGSLWIGAIGVIVVVCALVISEVGSLFLLAFAPKRKDKLSVEEYFNNLQGMLILL
jgi:hypothetical protein